MARRGPGRPIPNPWVWEDADFQGDVIRVTVSFNDTSRAVTGITAFRDPNCQYRRILIGTSADGNPDDTDKAIAVPAGTTVLTSQQLAVLRNRGLATIEDIRALQITAGR